MNAKELHELTQCGLQDCRNAIDYANSKLDVVAVAYLRSRSLAVATHGMSFDQRAYGFMDSAENYIKRHKAQEDTADEG